MTLEKRLQLRKGDISLCIFKGKMGGKLFITFDKENAGRTIKGPLFTEEEMYELASLILDYDEWESKVVNGSANKRLVREPADEDKPSLMEVRSAIDMAKQGRGTMTQGEIGAEVRLPNPYFLHCYLSYRPASSVV